MIKFDKTRLFFVGYASAVAQCTLPILFKYIKVSPKNITPVIDFEDRRDILKPWLAKGVKFVKDRVGENNLMARSSANTQAAGDVLIDLAWNIDCCELLTWCQRSRGVLYVNTSVEIWDPYAGRTQQASDRTHALLASHERGGASRPSGSSPAPPPCWSMGPTRD